MLSESVLSVRKELFPQNKTAVSDMPKVNIQKKVQPTDADMVQTSLSFENIYYSLWEIAGRYSSFCQFRVIGNSHDERMIPMLEVGTGAQMIFCVAGINGTQALLPELLLKMAGEYCRAYECGWKLDEFYGIVHNIRQNPSNLRSVVYSYPAHHLPETPDISGIPLPFL